MLPSAYAGAGRKLGKKGWQQGGGWVREGEDLGRAESGGKRRKSDPAANSPGVGSAEAGNLCCFLSPFGLFQWTGNSRWTQADLGFKHTIYSLDFSTSHKS